MNMLICKEDLLTEIEAELNSIDLAVTGRENAQAVADAFQKLFDVIREEPESVVRCADCRKYGTNECAMHFDCAECKGDWSWNNADDFCSWADRRRV